MKYWNDEILHSPTTLWTFKPSTASTTSKAFIALSIVYIKCY